MQEASQIHNIALNEKGQSIFEFVLLIVIVTILGFALLKGINGAVAERWRAMIIVISSPTATPIELR